MQTIDSSSPFAHSELQMCKTNEMVIVLCIHIYMYSTEEEISISFFIHF